jgi:hypothetical protein
MLIAPVIVIIAALVFAVRARAFVQDPSGTYDGTLVRVVGRSAGSQATPTPVHVSVVCATDCVVEVTPFSGLLAADVPFGPVTLQADGSGHYRGVGTREIIDATCAAGPINVDLSTTADGVSVDFDHPADGCGGATLDRFTAAAGSAAAAPIAST